MDFIRKTIFTYFPLRFPIRDVRTIFAGKFDTCNHLVKTLSEYDAGIRSYRESSLFKFHKKFQPESIFDFISSIDNERLVFIREAFPKGKYPWGSWSKDGKSWEKSRFCGPTSEECIRDEWERFINLYEKVKKEGFIYGKYKYPTGVLLDGIDSQRRFVVLAGNHRTAVAFHLGVQELKVRLICKNNINSVVQLSGIKKWQGVANGISNEDEAMKAFRLFFA